MKERKIKETDEKYWRLGAVKKERKKERKKEKGNRWKILEARSSEERKKERKKERKRKQMKNTGG